jgi:hypothetical protein
MPIASAEELIIAMAESPLILLLEVIFSSAKAEITTTGKAMYKGVTFIAAPIAKAPKPTWLKPSPIIEYFFSTKITPSNAAHSETKEPTMKALVIKP